MSNNPSYQPTPVAGPTAVPTYNLYNLPNIPSNAYQLLSNFADAIDTANSKLNGHASKLSDINTSANNAVQEVTLTSKGLATDTLSNIWKSSQDDINKAQSQLAAITTYPGGLGGGNQSLGWVDFRTTLNENKAAIQTGLIALENRRTSKVAEPRQQHRINCSNGNKTSRRWMEPSATSAWL